MEIIKTFIIFFIGVLFGIIIFYSLYREPQETVRTYILSLDSVPAEKEQIKSVLFYDQVDSIGNREIPFKAGLGMKVNWDSLKRKVWDCGDNQAYTWLIDYYIYHKSFKQEFLAYSYLMATKYHDASACFHVYNDLYELYYKRDLGTFEPETRTFALRFLHEGARRGNRNAMIALKELGQDVLFDN